MSNSRASIASRIAGFFGLNRNVLVMTAARSLRGFGSGMWNQYVPKVLETLGASAPMIGAFGTVNAGLATLFSYFGGAISDRIGRGRVLILSAGVAIAGYFIYAVSPLWWLFIPASIFLTASAFFDFMGSLALFGETVGGDRRAVSMASVGIITLPVSVTAPAVGGVVIAGLGMITGFRVAVVATIFLTIAGILIQRRFYRLPPPAANRLAINLSESWRAMPTVLRSMLLANAVMAFGSGLSSLFVVIYAMNVVGASAVQVGLLQSVLIASTSVLSIPIGKLSDRRSGLGRKPYVAFAFGLVGVFPLLLILAPSPAWLWGIWALRGVRETFDTVRKAMIVDLAGEGERGRVIGLYFFIQGVAGFPAGLIAGFLWQWNNHAPFIAGAIVCTIGFVLFLFVRRPKEDAPATVRWAG